MKKLVLILLILWASAQASGQWVTGYWPTWSEAAPTSMQIDFGVWTHIVHQNLKPIQTPPYYTFDNAQNGGVNGSATFETAQGTGYTYPAQESLITRAHRYGRKVILGLGGINDGGNWTWMYDNGHLPEYVHNVMDYIRLRGYDGIDIDWEWNPGGHDLVAFNRLVHMFRDSLDAPPRQRGTICIASWPFVSQTSWNLDTIKACVDQVNVMEYDMNWSGTTAHHAPLHPYTCDSRSQIANVETQMNAYVAAGYPKSILGVGLPFYGFSWPVGADGLCQPSGTAFQASYYYFHNFYKNNPERYHWDDVAKQSWLGWTDTLGKHFMSFDDTSTIFEKAKWAKGSGFGGVMVWELGRGYESGLQPLADALKRAISVPIIVPPIDTTKKPPLTVTCNFDSAKATVVCPPAVHDTFTVTNTVTLHDTLRLPAIHDTLFTVGINPKTTYKYFSSSYSDSAVTVLLRNGALIYYMGTKSSTGVTPIRGYKP